MLVLYLSMISGEEERSLFEELYIQYRKQMFIVANSVLNNEADAEDAVHDVFCTVAANMDTVNKIMDPTDRRNYLLKAAKNKAINFKVRQRSRSESLDSAAIYRLESDDFVDDICCKAEFDGLMKAIHDLDDKYREVIYYRFVLELSPKEIAALTERPLNTVSKQIRRAKSILAESFSSVCEGSEVCG